MAIEIGGGITIGGGVSIKGPMTLSLALGGATAPYVSAYPVTEAGFGTKFSDPATAVGGIVNKVTFSPDNTAIAMAYSSSPYLAAYKWSQTSGFGTRYSDPSGTLSTGYACAFSPAGDAIAVGTGSSPYIHAYTWSSSSGFGTKYSNPSAQINGQVNDVTFRPAGTTLAVAMSQPPYIYTWDWTYASGFGSAYSSPFSAAPNSGQRIAYNPAGDVVALGTFFSSGQFGISAWSFSSSGYAFSKFSNPASPTAIGTCSGLQWTPSGDALIAAGYNTPYIYAWPWSNGYGTAFSNPTTLPPGSIYSLSISPDGKYVAFGMFNNSPYVGVYAWSSSTGFGTKFSDPGTAPSGVNGGTNSVAFTNAQ